MAKLTELQSLCLSYVDQLSTTNARVLAEAMDVEVKTVQRVLRTQGVKEAMLERARDKLAIAALDAANTITDDLLHATNDTEQGSLRLSAANTVLDRVGITSKEVVVAEASPLIVLPAKEVKAAFDAVEQSEDQNEE